MKKIYVVFGHTGEYEDSSRWAVRAFEKKRTATKFLKKCQKLVDDQKFEFYSFDHTRWKHPLDDHFHMDYTGTTYYLVEIPFEPEPEKCAPSYAFYPNH
jgi:hypothetical protein